MEYLAPIITVGVISLLASMSPGPDFIVVTKNSLLGNRKTGLYTALGVGLGIFVHVAYSLVGIGLIVSQSIILFSAIKYLGALYLFYLAYQLLKAKKPQAAESAEDQDLISLSPYKAVREGFLTNALNPKATLFFLSIFTQVITPDTPIFIQALLGVEVATIVGIWFSLLAILICFNPIKSRFAKFHFYLMKVMGGALVLLGLKLAFATK